MTETRALVVPSQSLSAASPASLDTLPPYMPRSASLRPAAPLTALPYLEPPPTPSQRAVALALIAAEAGRGPPLARAEPLPLALPLPPPRRENWAVSGGPAGAYASVCAVPDAPGVDEGVEVWGAALRRTEAAGCARAVDLAGVEVEGRYGGLVWRVRNEGVERAAGQARGVLERVRAEVKVVNRRRKERQVKLRAGVEKVKRRIGAVEERNRRLGEAVRRLEEVAERVGEQFGKRGAGAGPDAGGDGDPEAVMQDTTEDSETAGARIATTDSSGNREVGSESL
jgi:Breast carcinoma amplified sequence 2 (BCAS2)